MLDLRSLGLEQKYPRLTRLTTEVADLEQRLHKARAAQNLAQNRLPAARERDILAEAKAMRGGKRMPAPEEEPRVRAELEEAERQADRLAVALQSAREEHGEHLAAAQSDLYHDVRRARGAIAREGAEGAQVAQRAFARYSDLTYQLKALAPAEVLDENAPAQRLTNSFGGVITTARHAGPDRGTVEGVLSYIASLAPPEEPEDVGDDAA